MTNHFKQGPPQALCSALLLAANAACKPSSGGISFNKNNNGDGEPSLCCGDSVDAAVDTDDCCDRSVDLQSEVSTLHSQDGNMEEKINSSTNHSINLPLQRFLQRGEDDWSNSQSHNSQSHSRSPSRGSLSSASSRSRSRSRSRSPPSDGDYHRQNNIPST